MFQVATEDGYLESYDLADEDHSNWMIFVRPATCIAEQNLIAYQEDGHIFYVSLKVSFEKIYKLHHFALAKILGHILAHFNLGNLHP